MSEQTERTTLGAQSAGTESDDKTAQETEDRAGESAEEETKTEASDFTVYDLEGNAFHLSDFRGKPTVINFWASWCGPCKNEMPDFNEAFLAQGEEINFLMVNVTDEYRETLEIASSYIEEMQYSFPVYYDTEQDAAATYGISSLPTTYFIDAEGYFVAYARGMIDAETLQRGIEMIVAE